MGCTIEFTDEAYQRLDDSLAYMQEVLFTHLDYHKLSVSRYVVVCRIYEESRTVRIMSIFSELEDYEHKQ